MCTRGRRRRGFSLALRRTGVHRSAAARQSGVSIRTARDWDQGIRKTNNRRIYPDGRVIDYKRGVTTFIPATVSALEAVIDARYLSLPERENIRDLTATGASIRAIAKLIGRSPPGVASQRDRHGHLRALCRAPGRSAAPTAAEGLEVSGPASTAQLRERETGDPLVSRTYQSWFDQGVSRGSGDACVTRDDLPGPLLPGPRRAA